MIGDKFEYVCRRPGCEYHGQLVRMAINPAVFPSCRACGELLDSRRYCRYCPSPRPNGYSTTCGKSQCQEADAKANAERARGRR